LGDLPVTGEQLPDLLQRLRIVGTKSPPWLTFVAHERHRTP
jgi:hypothetical protein